MSVVNGYDIKLQSNVHKDTLATFSIKSRSLYTFTITVCKFPTSNCQVSSFGNMNFLLEYTNKNKEDVNAIIKECYNLISYKPLLILVDVKDTFIEVVERCFEVITKTPYISTNNSNMCLFLVKLVSPILDNKINVG